MPTRRYKYGVRSMAARGPRESASVPTPEPDGGLEAPGVDGPGRGQDDKDVDDHEDHGQEPDHEVGLSVENGGGARDRGERDPEHLGHEAHENESDEHET